MSKSELPPDFDPAEGAVFYARSLPDDDREAFLKEILGDGYSSPEEAAEWLRKDENNRKRRKILMLSTVVSASLISLLWLVSEDVRTLGRQGYQTIVNVFSGKDQSMPEQKDMPPINEDLERTFENILQYAQDYRRLHPEEGDNRPEDIREWEISQETLDFWTATHDAARLQKPFFHNHLYRARNNSTVFTETALLFISRTNKSFEQLPLGSFDEQTVNYQILLFATVYIESLGGFRIDGFADDSLVRYWNAFKWDTVTPPTAEEFIRVHERPRFLGATSLKPPPIPPTEEERDPRQAIDIVFEKAITHFLQGTDLDYWDIVETQPAPFPLPSPEEILQARNHPKRGAQILFALGGKVNGTFSELHEPLNSLDAVFYELVMLLTAPKNDLDRITIDWTISNQEIEVWRRLEETWGIDFSIPPIPPIPSLPKSAVPE